MSLAVGKRYRCSVCGAEFLSIRPGDVPRCDDKELEPVVPMAGAAPKPDEPKTPAG